MVTPTSLNTWLSMQARPLLILFGLLVLAYFILKISAVRRRRTLSQQREGVTEESFAEYMAEFGFDKLITTSTYRYLQQVQHVDFPILPSDTLEDLGLAPEDVTQSIADLTLALYRGYNPALAHAPVMTVMDLVRFLQAAPGVVRSHVA